MQVNGLLPKHYGSVKYVAIVCGLRSEVAFFGARVKWCYEAFLRRTLVQFFLYSAIPKPANILFSILKLKCRYFIERSSHLVHNQGTSLANIFI